MLYSLRRFYKTISAMSQKERCIHLRYGQEEIYLAFSRTVRCSWSGVKAHNSFSIDKALLCRSLSLNFTAGSDHWFCCCCCCCCCCDVIERSVAMAGDEHCSDDVAPGACKNGERGSIKIRVTGNCHLSNRPCKFSLICTLKTNVKLTRETRIKVWWLGRPGKGVQW